MSMREVELEAGCMPLLWWLVAWVAGIESGCAAAAAGWVGGWVGWRRRRGGVKKLS